MEERNFAYHKLCIFSVEDFIKETAKNWIETAQESIEKRGSFHVALSGGSTPQAIYKEISEQYRSRLDWDKVYLYWSDERWVTLTDSESNYGNAMNAGLAQLPFDEAKIFPMRTSEDKNESEQHYQEILEKNLPDGCFDLVMLGLGNDGHSASLFEETSALKVENSRWVAANFVPKLDSWRLTLTLPCIHRARLCYGYVSGEAKAQVLKEISLSTPTSSALPAALLGREQQAMTWFCDSDAASLCQPIKAG